MVNNLKVNPGFVRLILMDAKNYPIIHYKTDKANKKIKIFTDFCNYHTIDYTPHNESVCLYQMENSLNSYYDSFCRLLEERLKYDKYLISGLAVSSLLIAYLKEPFIFQVFPTFFIGHKSHECYKLQKAKKRFDEVKQLIDEKELFQQAIDDREFTSELDVKTRQVLNKNDGHLNLNNFDDVQPYDQIKIYKKVDELRGKK